jgi:polyisoprenyl-phosphate glycosyltransferase
MNKRSAFIRNLPLINKHLYYSTGASTVNPIPLISVVIPFYNELEVLPICLERVHRVLLESGIRFEVVFIDDGSHDGGAAWLSDHLEEYPGVRLVQLSRNFGKEAAVTAGIDLARGEALILLDADLQDPPELIPNMVATWQQGADVVLMRRASRSGETWLKKACARAFYRVLYCLSPIDMPIDVGDFRLMNRKTIQALQQYPERNRYMKGLFAAVGMTSVVLDYHRESRVAGTTKWSQLKLIGLAMDAITSFTALPLRITSFIGFLFSFASFLFALYVVIKAITVGGHVPGYPSLAALITWLGGVQLIAIGLVGEYVGKTYIESKQRPVYVLKEHEPRYVTQNSVSLV